MSYTTTTRLALQKAVPGSNQAFETTVFNSNWDKIDADNTTLSGRLNTVEGTVAVGTVNAATTATKATKITASGLDRTIFVAGTAPSSGMVTGDIWIKA